ncbi:hypothetical protein MPTK1_3g14540 [Marchantia polymorpha subsp. ruderalis]|uniref:Protein kinase domain-containing protein n=2 Tax=Marchantia polymorpha TaxID=3197 RepID=A0AAF6B0S5_MARPO|nr:hypothetical protein MARPO_0004s0217 [Marchantia polymorpha]BBN05609.1 hypothetical protein Mp_3g14540 [Marchantia polymorpha subsp. ruderalis]|eukprot:PTQ48973.1 hypothetical protein MARPO_0004s0217 [Marchantia polymorpha]
MKVQEFTPPSLGARPSPYVDVDPSKKVTRLEMEIFIVNGILPPHRNIAQIKDVLISKTTVYIVQELCGTKSLLDFYGDADDRSARRVFKQLVDVTHFIHQYGVVHPALYGRRILFADSSYTDVKLIDFGSSHYNPSTATRVRDNFNPAHWFTGGELDTRYKRGWTPQEDIASLGRILHNILAGEEVDHFGFDEDYGREHPANEKDFEILEDEFKPRVDVFDAQALNLLSIIGPSYFRNQAPLPRSLDQILLHPWLAEPN